MASSASVGLNLRSGLAQECCPSPLSEAGVRLCASPSRHSSVTGGAFPPPSLGASRSLGAGLPAPVLHLIEKPQDSSDTPAVASKPVGNVSTARLTVVLLGPLPPFSQGPLGQGASVRFLRRRPDPHSSYNLGPGCSSCSEGLCAALPAAVTLQPLVPLFHQERSDFSLGNYLPHIQV